MYKEEQREGGTDAVDDVGRGTSKCVCDMKGTMMVSCEVSDARDVRACLVAGSETGEETGLGDRCREKTVKEEVTQIQGFFEGWDEVRENLRGGVIGLELPAVSEDGVLEEQIRGVIFEG